MKSLKFAVVVAVVAGFALSTTAYAQVAGLPAGYRSPVDHPIRVSGTFGELRADHFHMGLDVKSSRGRDGDPLYAVADGFVSRVKISAAGYGNALYLDHPNGMRSVYAHMETLAPAIRAFVDSVSYVRESFEVDIRLSPKRLPVTRGQRLGTMGNTGSSFGTHLHYELRRAADDAAVNPMLAGFPVRDTRAPDIRQLSVYRVDGDGRTTLLRQVTPTRSGDDYRVASPIRVPAGRVAFGLKAVDRIQGQSNRNGVYRTALSIDGREVWRVTYDTIPYADTRYIQAHYDFQASAEGAGYYYRLHRLRGDRLGIYDVVEEDGSVVLGFGERRPMEVWTEDALGNRAVLRFEVEGTDEQARSGPAPYNFVLEPGEATDFRLGDASFSVPPSAAYAKTFLAADLRVAGLTGALSSCYDVGTPTEPVHDAIGVRVPLHNVPAGLRTKAYLGPCDPNPRDRDTDGRWRQMPAQLSADGAALVGEMEEWAPFAVHVDTVPPTIRRLSPGVYRIEDDVTDARRLRYRVTEDGEWVLAEFDAKRNRLTVREDKWDGGDLRVAVADEAGNRRAL